MYTSAVTEQIPVLCATGTGGTTLSAFHDALVANNLGHYNLLRLSSVIPPNTSVDATGKAEVPVGEWGDKLYCVYAEQSATEIGEQAWAGIGWVQRLDGKGGLFVEHEGTSEQYVENAIRTSLRDLVRGREDEFTAGDWVLNGAVCTGEPICSMVIAPYETGRLGGCPMRITIESSIADEHVDMFYRIYAAAFGPMQARAAARHLLTAAEFAEEMSDKRIDKYVVWNDDDEPIALTTLTNDLSAVPWISPAFYAARYPEESARGAVFYLGYTLIHPERRVPGAFPAVMQRLVERVQEVNGVGVFDVCAYNDGRGVGRMWDHYQSTGLAQVERVDVQTYYAMSFPAPSLAGAPQ